MPNIRELIGSATSSRNLTMSYDEERAIDRVAAMASVSDLGSALLRLKYGQDAGSYNHVHRRLQAKAARRQKADPVILDRMAARVLYEFVNDQCDKCHGRTWVQRAAARRPCRACSGTGKRVVRDADRAAALGLATAVYVQHWARRFEHMLDVLRSADADAAKRLQTDLERRSVRAITRSQPAQSQATR